MPTMLPKAPLPPVLVSTKPGTWAHDTMSRRVREEILARVFRENNFHHGTLSRLRALDAELANADSTPLTPIVHDGGPDVHMWNNVILKPSLDHGKTWLSAPWAVAEFYLYRRLMTAIEYFQEPIDPFSVQKELGLTTAISSIATLAARSNALIQFATQKNRSDLLTDLKAIVLAALWGNRMDLSLWPVGGTDIAHETPVLRHRSDAFASVIEAGQKMILSNDMESLIEYISKLPPDSRMDIIVDNAGFELFCDLCLADFLVCSKLAKTVHIQLKAHPTFVSDAMAKDVLYTIEFLQRGVSKSQQSPAVYELGKRWASHIEHGRWVLNEDFFWVQPSAMWDMPKRIADELLSSNLVFIKGDANYRRLLGDRDWAFDTPFADIACYFPSPVCALRTLKAELGCGMEKHVQEEAMKEDKRWLVAGKYGVIQFLDTQRY